MRLIFLFSLLLYSVLSLSCGDDNPPKIEQGPDAAIFQKRVILLIDVSSSITKDSRLLAARYAGQVAHTLSDESHLMVYTTEKNTAQQAIVDIKKAIPLKPMAKAHFESTEWPAKVKWTSETVLANCQKGQSVSCIIDGLKSVRTGLANASKAKETYLLVISDMLECCEIGNPKVAKDFIGMKSKLEKSDLGDFQLAAKIPQDHVKICYINQNARPGNAAMIASPEFRAFWQQAFKILGYTDMPEPGTSIDAFLELTSD